MDYVNIQRIDDDRVKVVYNGKVFSWTMEQARSAYIDLSLWVSISLRELENRYSNVL